ncbi:peptidase S16 [Aeromicrobium sp. SMF47]|uniref:LON peptidase substrate-binding domain-containing protein n=1 Tax=Aeromicrobium yanjiei TaxID=2662028 RepID=UPI00129EF022|nr:LON peptidase substrate-binding domain-containing protein [Aeromicrobium yanjiei]MRJ75733.1 peptidase S16 [Aeromicrobium yanjiei]
MEDLVELPMFPLGSVLFPAMPLPLRIFEDRYLQMLQDVLVQEPAEFGVVLIERGHEVGGGEHRFATGTVAQVVEVGEGDGFISLLAQGGRRFEVVEWLPEAPYPRATVRLRPALEWDERWRDRFDEVEELVRVTMARISEFEEQRWSSTIGLADEPLAALWQLAAIAPIGAYDQLSLLAATSVEGLLDAVATATVEAAELRLPD